MGSGTSKAAAAAAPSGAGRGERSRGAGRVFNSSCFGLPSTTDDPIEEENGRSKGKNSIDKGESIPSDGNPEPCKKLIIPRLANTAAWVSSDLEVSRKDQEGTSQIDSGASSSSTTTATISRSSNPSGRLRSRFGFNHEGISFRLSRTVSLGSSGSGTHFSAGLSIPNRDGSDHVCINHGNCSCSRNDTRENTSAHINPSQDVVSNNPIIESTVSGHSHRNRAENESSFELRRSSRRLGSQESLEGSVRFSRTLSVGRLRERVLRGPSLSEGLFGSTLLEDRPVAYMSQSSERRLLGSIRRTPSSNRSNEGLPESSDNRYHRSTSEDSGHGQDSGIPLLREAGNHDLLEHRSSFLERRRRIRSQVRALQRLGSRFENLSGHDRSCILSGLHRTGRCTCRMTNRPANLDDDMSNRASISRIVMLAEALFEVLDEIHQQSVVLSSRPSFSSIGSAPAPREVVECMPLRAYTKTQKHQNDEIDQCYICLTEYEIGDSIRLLPCNHEFHQICIDKWLKEIHRVCPLCRGDVCRTNVLNIEKFG